MRATILILSFALSLGLSPSSEGGDPRLNEIQVIGSHNSYHIAPAPSLLSMIGATGIDAAKGLDYTHKALGEQFQTLGIRQIELDLYADPRGGHYASPITRATLTALGKDPGPDPNTAGILDKPGIKIIHIPDLDYLSNAPTLVSALKQIKVWSQANPRHVPIFVLLELKERNAPKLIKPLPFDRSQFEGLEAEILSVFDKTALLTPDDVRGDSPTLPEAVQRKGWPSLDSVRGRLMFALDNEDKIRDLYLEDHENLKGRLLFTSVEEGHPAAGWFKVNDPVRDFDRIRALVKKGFLVRTRADANTVNARANDTRQRDQALASGAQFVSTDYPEPDRRFSEYQVHFAPGIVARTNPVSGVATSGEEADLENLKAP